MLKPAYNERKAAQVAHLLLNLRGGKMSYIKLIKLMYFIDRAALVEWGRSVTFDSIVSMDNGMVLSQTLNLITCDVRPNTHSVWSQFVSTPVEYEVGATNIETDYDELSDMEEDLVRKVFGEFGNKSRWNLVDFHHKLPEWIDPEGSSIPLTYREILQKSGKRSYSDIESIGTEIEGIAILEQFT